MSTETVERTDAEILDAAADRIERDGWHQGFWFPGKRPPTMRVGEYIRENSLPCCAGGAIDAETDFERDGGHPWRTFSRYLHEMYGTGDLVSFNDRPERTKEEVVAALRAAAAQARGESA